MFQGVVVSVFDNVGHDFLNGEVSGENDVGGCVIALEKLRRCVSGCGKIIEIAIDLEDEIGHGRRFLDAEDRSQFFAEDEAGSDDGGAEEAHGPNAQRTGNKASIAEQLIEFVNGLRDRIVLLSLCENERVADLEHGKGKCEQGAGQEIRHDEGDGDFHQRSERWAAEVLRRFLKGDTRLLKSRRGGTDDVGEPANAIGDHENRQGILDRVERSQELPLLCHGQITECKNDAGNCERKHSHCVEDLASGKFRAHDNIGDGDAQDDIHESGEAGVFEAVLNGRERETMTESVLKVLKRPAARKDRAIPIARKGDEDDTEMRKNGKGGNCAKEQACKRRSSPARLCEVRPGSWPWPSWRECRGRTPTC